eukprot:scaffold66481_cov48-Phaeocystis_antarctica.AAC.1
MVRVRVRVRLRVRVRVTVQPAAAEATLECRAGRCGEQAVALRQVMQRPRRAHADLRRPRRAACGLDRARSPRGRLGLG